MAENDRQSEQLETLIRLVAMTVVADKPTLREQIGLLSRAGLQPKWIADLLGTTPNTVSVELSKLRKASGRNKGKKKVMKKIVAGGPTSGLAAPVD